MKTDSLNFMFTRCTWMCVIIKHRQTQRDQKWFESDNVLNTALLISRLWSVDYFPRLKRSSNVHLFHPRLKCWVSVYAGYLPKWSSSHPALPALWSLHLLPWGSGNNNNKNSTSDTMLLHTDLAWFQKLIPWSPTNSIYLSKHSRFLLA